MAETVESQEHEVEAKSGEAVAGMQAVPSMRELSLFEEMERLFGHANRAVGGLFPRGWMRPLPLAVPGSE